MSLYVYGRSKIKCQSAKHRPSLTTEVFGSTVQYYDIENKQTVDLVIRHQKIYYGISSAITLYQDQSVVPFLGVIKLYETIPEFQAPAYVILYIQENVASINIISQLSSENHCPNVRTLWRSIAHGELA